MGFQDGGSTGLFVRAARTGWQVEVGGAPVVCFEVPFFPSAVMMAWSLPTNTAGDDCSVRPARQVSSQTFAVTISIPGDWQPTPDLGADRFGYDGASGWVQLNAMVDIGRGGCLTPAGKQCLYSLLLIYADPAHLAAIVDSVQLHH